MLPIWATQPSPAATGTAAAAGGGGGGTASSGSGACSGGVSPTVSIVAAAPAKQSATLANTQAIWKPWVRMLVELKCLAHVGRRWWSLLLILGKGKVTRKGVISSGVCGAQGAGLQHAREDSRVVMMYGCGALGSYMGRDVPRSTQSQYSGRARCNVRGKAATLRQQQPGLAVAATPPAAAQITPTQRLTRYGSSLGNGWSHSLWAPEELKIGIGAHNGVKVKER